MITAKKTYIASLALRAEPRRSLAAEWRADVLAASTATMEVVIEERGVARR